MDITRDGQMDMPAQRS